MKSVSTGRTKGLVFALHCPHVISIAWVRRAGRVSGGRVKSLYRHRMETLVNAGVSLAVSYTRTRVRRSATHPGRIWKWNCRPSIPLGVSVVQCPAIIASVSPNTAVNVREVHRWERQEVNAKLLFCNTVCETNRRVEPESERTSWIRTLHLSWHCIDDSPKSIATFSRERESWARSTLTDSDE
eukprot:4302715-Pleurochrysis_carterae.AAC.1